MGNELVAWAKRFIEFHNEGLEEGAACARELLELPPEEWEAWWNDHPEAWSYATTGELLAYADEQLRTSGPSALSITEFMIRHVDDIVVPPDMSHTRAILRHHAWQTHAQALRSSGRLDEARQADETVATIARTENIPGIDQRPPTENDIRRANELIEKYGLHHLRHKD